MALEAVLEHPLEYTKLVLRSIATFVAVRPHTELKKLHEATNSRHIYNAIGGGFEIANPYLKWLIISAGLAYLIWKIRYNSIGLAIILVTLAYYLASVTLISKSVPRLLLPLECVFAIIYATLLVGFFSVISRLWRHARQCPIITD